MRHAFLDHHAGGDSVLHRLHPATKTGVAALVLLLAVVIPFPRFTPFVPAALFLLGAALASRVSLVHLFGKMKIPLGITLLAVIWLPLLRTSPQALPLFHRSLTVRLDLPGAWLALHVMTRAAVALFAMVLLTAITPFQDLLGVLEKIRLPGVLLRILAVFYRYLFILVDEAEKMQMAIAGRSLGRLSTRRRLAMSGNLAGSLFLRSLERGESIYLAMCARGFEGRFPSLSTPAWGRRDMGAIALGGITALGTVVLILH